MSNELLTVRGKLITIPASFRLPLLDYQRVVEFCNRRGEIISGYTVKLWQRGLTTNEVEVDCESRGCV